MRETEPTRLAPAARPDRDGFEYAARVALFYAAVFIIYGIAVPYLPVWLDWKGLSPSDIGIVIAAPYFVRMLVTPAVTLLADAYGQHRRFIVACAVVVLAAALLLTRATGFWVIALFSTVMAIAMQTIIPLTETVAMDGVRRSGLDYGRMRLWGSATFILASSAGGAAIDAYGGGAGMWLIICGAVATVLAGLCLPGRSADAPAPATSPAEAGIRAAEALRLVRQPLFLVFLVAVGAVQASHATFYTFGTLHWRSQGIDGSVIGVLWAIGVLAEIVLFAFSAAVLRRFGVMPLMLLGASAAVLRWTAVAFNPPLLLLWPLQVLHALSYGASHIAAIHFIGKAIPQAASGTAQGLYATVAAGLGLGGATVASGWLYPMLGGRAYLAMAGLAAIGLFAATVLARRWQGGTLVPQPVPSSARQDLAAHTLSP